MSFYSCGVGVPEEVEARRPVIGRLFDIMDRKDHYAWSYLTKPGLSKPQLLVHFRHEYQTYVRDFPVLLARVLGLGPPDRVRKALAENIYEEQTGKLSVSRSHPELFLEMMAGLGFSKNDLEQGPLTNQAQIYRSFLDQVSMTPPWVHGAAVLTLFVEGSRHDRAEFAGTRTRPSPESLVESHPLVVHYGCPTSQMDLVRAHGEIEGSHRKDAWEMLIENIPDGSRVADEVCEVVEKALRYWLDYRDSVAQLMGLSA